QPRLRTGPSELLAHERRDSRNTELRYEATQPVRIRPWWETARIDGRHRHNRLPTDRSFRLVSSDDVDGCQRYASSVHLPPRPRLGVRGRILSVSEFRVAEGPLVPHRPLR